MRSVQSGMDQSKPLSRDLTDRLLSNAPTNKPNSVLNDLLSMTKQNNYTTPDNKQFSNAAINQLSPIPASYNNASNNNNN